MLFDFLRGRGPRSSRAPEVERVAPGTWRIELVGDPPVLVESGPVPPRRTGYVPAGQDLSAFLLRAGDARGEVAAVLTVGPSKSLGDHVSHLRHGHAAWRVLEMNGLLGFLAPGRFEPPGAARGPLFGALARAAAALAAEHGAATVVAARDLGAAPFSSQPETMRESTEAEARLDEAFARAGYTKDAPYGFSEGGSVWMRRGAVVRRTLKAPGFVIPLSPRDAAWIDGMVRACRELLAHRGGDDVLESALATVERWREGQTSTRDLQETEAAVRAHRHRHPTMAVPVEHLLRVLLHREAHRGDSPEDIFTWRKRTDRGRRALVSAFVSTYGEMPDEAAAHVAAYLHERPLSF